MKDIIPDYMFQKCIENGLVTYDDNDSPALTDAGKRFIVTQLNNEIDMGELAQETLDHAFTPEEIEEYSS